MRSVTNAARRTGRQGARGRRVATWLPIASVPTTGARTVLAAASFRDGCACRSTYERGGNRSNQDGATRPQMRRCCAARLSGIACGRSRGGRVVIGSRRLDAREEGRAARVIGGCLRRRRGLRCA
ncbi:Hypothetical protein A7982_01543 [Minicystis rosea]|nr:Hypothetical protein A7982_01543 [Minicystis rosea]